jgi:hypothetical protein
LRYLLATAVYDLAQETGKTMNLTIVLIHPNGEGRTVPVEHVTETYVTIRWGLAGIYDLNLKDNVLTQRSRMGQTKGKAKWYKKDNPEWRAANIETVRTMVREYLMGEADRKLADDMARHARTMPR